MIWEANTNVAGYIKYNWMFKPLLSIPLQHHEHLYKNMEAEQKFARFNRFQIKLNALK